MAVPSAKAGGDVLVIDDDAILRDLVADWLLAAGYKVRKAANCQAALQAIEEDQLKRYAPAALLIAVSGYFKSGSGVSADEALSAGAARALAKPVRRAQLLTAVSELIGPPD